MNTQRPTAKITQPEVAVKKTGPDLTAPEVLNQALATLQEHVHLPRPPKADYGQAEIFSVLLYAAAHRTTIEQSCAALKKAPHPNTVRNSSTAVKLESLEDQINQALAHYLPKNLGKRPQEVAIDLKLVPYYGEPLEGEENFIIKGKATQGTNSFFAYASLYLIKNNKRYTLAVVAVRREEGALGAIKRLWSWWLKLGFEMKCLYLDRGFYSVAVLRWLLQNDIPFVMAAPKKGKQGGIAGLVKRRGVGVWPYTVTSANDGSLRVEVAVVGKYFKGRWGKRGRQFYAFVVHRFPFGICSLWQRYRRRFGIESSHRLWEQARARTASRRAGLRLLLVGIAIVLHNLWVWLKWAVASWPRRGGRKVWQKGLPFRRLLFFLAQAVQRRLGTVDVLILPLNSAPKEVVVMY